MVPEVVVEIVHVCHGGRADRRGGSEASRCRGGLATSVMVAHVDRCFDCCFHPQLFLGGG